MRAAEQGRALLSDTPTDREEGRVKNGSGDGGAARKTDSESEKRGWAGRLGAAVVTPTASGHGGM
jgi:hypothetical protein